MQKIINWLFKNNLDYFFAQSKIHVTWQLTVAAVVGWFYLIFLYPAIILYTIYVLIMMLIILLHILVVKHFNLKFDEHINIQPIQTNNFFIFLLKMLFLQGRVFLLATWVCSNLLVQGELNSRLTDISINLMPNFSFVMLMDGLVNWIVFISVLLGIGFYKYHFRFSSIRFAKCLLPNVNNQPGLFFYNILLGMESYIRVMSFITLLTVLSVALFSIISSKYKLFDFLKYPMITSFVVLVVFYYSKQNLEKSIDFCCKKKSMDFINIFMILFFCCNIVIFVVNQLLLGQIEFLKILSEQLTTKSIFINNFFKNTVVNQDRIKILFVGLNIVLTAGASDLFIKQIGGYKVGVIYFASCIFPLIYSIFFCKFGLNIVLNNLLTTNTANLLMLLAIVITCKMNYKNIYHVFCFFNLKHGQQHGALQSIKVGFSLVIKRTITIYFLYLSSYYMFSWVLTEHIIAIAVLCILSIVSMLIGKILWCTRDCRALGYSANS